MSATVEIQEDDGVYTAVDSETGEVGTGKTRAIALAVLSINIQNETDEVVSGLDSKTALQVLSARTQARFEEEDVTEDDIEGNRAGTLAIILGNVLVSGLACLS